MVEKRFLLLLFGWVLFMQVNAQHTDFLGAGHSEGIQVTSSSAKTTSPQSTVDGFDIKSDAQLKDASRFLAQTTFGADWATIEMTAAMGYEAWLDEQFDLPYTSVVDEMVDQAERPFYDGMYNPWFRASWITSNLQAPDLLKKRLAFAWSEIMVINDEADFFEDNSQFVAHFYDELGRYTTKNFKGLLTHVARSPAMGLFLSHFNNPKADPERNIHPDENFAREIMQLFSIGLWELNADGTKKLDENGQPIPTYTNKDIKEFAQVFTGLSNGMDWGEFGIDPSDFYGSDSVIMITTTPMRMYDEFHDKSEKNLLKGFSIPAGQSGEKDLEQALSHLLTHDNTAPFICKSLIKLLTSSNPSPQYVKDVVSVFDPMEPENLKKVVKTIFLHPEVRKPVTEAYVTGKLREPMVRLMNLLRAFPLSPNSRGDYPMDFYCLGLITGQSPMAAPSVFNFFLPDYAPQGLIEDADLIAPEYHILNSTSAIGIVNDLNFRVYEGRYMSDYCVQGITKYDWDLPKQRLSEGAFEMNFKKELELSDQPEALVRRLNILLANGLLESDTRDIIEDAITQIEEPLERVKMGIYLTMISPDYAILK